MASPLPQQQCAGPTAGGDGGIMSVALVATAVGCAAGAWYTVVHHVLRHVFYVTRATSTSTSPYPDDQTRPDSSSPTLIQKSPMLETFEYTSRDLHTPLSALFRGASACGDFGVEPWEYEAARVIQDAHGAAGTAPSDEEAAVAGFHGAEDLKDVLIRCQLHNSWAGADASMTLEELLDWYRDKTCALSNIDDANVVDEDAPKSGNVLRVLNKYTLAELLACGW